MLPASTRQRRPKTAAERSTPGSGNSEIESAAPLRAIARIMKKTRPRARFGSTAMCCRRWRTRTASITGAHMSHGSAVDNIRRRSRLRASSITDSSWRASVSACWTAAPARLELRKDKDAGGDFNVVRTAEADTGSPGERGRRGKPSRRRIWTRLLALAGRGITHCKVPGESARTRPERN